MDFVSFFLVGLGIFALRVVDITLYTTRFLMVVSGRKRLAWLFGFFQALIFITVIRSVITSTGEWNRIIGYSAGFATGLIVGMFLESRMALGYSQVRIISSRLGTLIADVLREQGYGLTEISGQGKDGVVSMISCYVPRRQTERVVKTVEKADPEAFVTIESVRSVQRGFWPK